MNIQPIAGYLKTKKDADEFQQVLGHLSDGLYKTSGVAEEELRRTLPYEQAIEVKKIAIEEGVSLDNKAAAQELLHKISQAISGIPVVQVTVAMTPKAELVDKIHDWFYRTYQSPVVLDVKVKPEIIGGCVINFNGKHHDYSLAKATDDLVSQSLPKPEEPKPAEPVPVAQVSEVLHTAPESQNINPAQPGALQV